MRNTQNALTTTTTTTTTTTADVGPHAPYALYAPFDLLSDADRDALRTVMLARLTCRPDACRPTLCRPDHTPTSDAPCADCLALRVATDLRDLPLGARLLDPRRYPYRDVVDCAQEAITAWWMRAKLYAPSAFSDDPTESDADAVDLLTWQMEHVSS